ncbi:MAG: RNA polymerase sigma factor [Steroidobacteraceae bacterium]
MSNDVIDWIADHVLPHEADVRHWLRRSRISRADEDDVIQEAYCRLAALERINHIGSGRAYLFVTVKNIIRERLRRERIVRIESVAEISSLSILDMEPSSERQVSDGQLLSLVRSMIDKLPERCRNVLILRKIEGLSQRDTARRLGVTENVVEKEVAYGLRAILKNITERGLDEDYGAIRRKQLR